MIIDVKPKDLGLPTEAYISVEEVHDVRALFVFKVLCETMCAKKLFVKRC